MDADNARKYDQPQPGSIDEQRRIDVRVELDDGGHQQIIIQDLSYGPGIGWYAQKTIRLDPEQLETLLGALSCARQESRRMGNSTRKNRKAGHSADNISTDTAHQILQLADFLDLETS
jgi:hypothetical protein